jgi:hypothetical protein
MHFGMGIGSDHRCLWIEIRTRVLIGQELEQSRKFAARWLKCDDPIVRNKYINHYGQYIEKKQLRERSRKLESDGKELGLTQQQAQEYEQLDALRKKGVYEAQQECRKFRTGEKDWTPKTTLLEIRVLFLLNSRSPRCASQQTYRHSSVQNSRSPSCASIQTYRHRSAP